MTAKVEIYTWSRGSFCIKAKSLLDRKGAEYSEYCIDSDENARTSMKIRVNEKFSLPQIFIEDRHIGSCDDMHALDSKGELEPLL